MRFKVVVALSLALVMLVTLATPALAAAPQKGGFAIYPPETADRAIYSLQATHDNDLKVTVVLRGASPSTQYRVILMWGTGGVPGNGVALDYVTTNERGNLRYTIKQGPWGGVRNFQLKLLKAPYTPDDIAFMGGIRAFIFD
jgi:hypothetical protein